MLLYYKGLESTKASYATLAELSFPMTGVLINWVVYNQVVTPAQLIGFTLIWVVLFIISNQRTQQEQAAKVQPKAA
ncbi:EamA-like transporter family protein [compost metagenome]